MFASRTNWPLEPNRFAQALEAHRRSGEHLLDLTASNPTACGFTYPVHAILAALADPRALVYRPDSKGLREAREAVASYYQGRAGFGSGNECALDPEKIILTSGTSEGYSHIFRLLCEPGDEVLVPVPGYPLFEFLADLADIRLVSYPLLYDHGWQIDLEALRSALTPRSRAMLLVHPNNPTGSLVKHHEAVELARICAHHDLALVVDEVFLDYPALDYPALDYPALDDSSIGRPAPDGSSLAYPTLGGPAPGHLPIAYPTLRHPAPDYPTQEHSAPAAPATFAFHSDALTFTLSGISKIAALPQMKLAWVIVSGPEAPARASLDRLEIIADTYLSPSIPVQLALAHFLDLRGALQAQLQQRIAANQAYLDDMLLRVAGPLQRLAREAGWYAVLRVPSSLPDDDLAVDLLEQCSVLVHPGQFFNFAQNGFLVLSLIAPEADFQEGARRLCEFFARRTGP
jgi:alanine-synthesizing transaminase